MITAVVDIDVALRAIRTAQATISPPFNLEQVITVERTLGKRA
jgi:hypothetical protein